MTAGGTNSQSYRGSLSTHHTLQVVYNDGPLKTVKLNNVGCLKTEEADVLLSARNDVQSYNLQLFDIK